MFSLGDRVRIRLPGRVLNFLCLPHLFCCQVFVCGFLLVIVSRPKIHLKLYSWRPKCPRVRASTSLARLKSGGEQCSNCYCVTVEQSMLIT